jgi:hypothetical protein
MKKFIPNMLAICLICFLTTMALAVTTPASAAEVLLNTEIETVQVRQDKNGNEYAMFVIKLDKTLNGVAYTTDAVVMAFGDMVAAAKEYQAGQMLKAIASTNQYQGRTNYNILAFVE